MPKLSISIESYTSESENGEVFTKKGVNFYYVIKVVLAVLGVFLALITVGVVIPGLFGVLYKRATVDKHIGMCSIDPSLMVECFPGVDVDVDTCFKWDCCWKYKSDFEVELGSRCYHRLPSSYRLMTPDQLQKNWNVTNRELAFPLRLQTYRSSVSTNWIDHNRLNSSLQLSVMRASSQRLQLRFTTNYSDLPDTSSAQTIDSLYGVKAVFTEGGCVDIFVTRVETGKRIFSINCVGSLVITESYTEMTILLPRNSSLFGLGYVNKDQLERPFNSEKWMLLSQMSDFDKDSSLYGAHPQYLCVEEDGRAHGVIFNTSQVMEVSLLPIPAVVIRTPGPILDIHIALGPTPTEVVSQLTDIPGLSERPALPPFWALGYHLCPVGSVDFLEDMKKLKKRGIPLASHCINSDIFEKLLFEIEDEDTFFESSDLQEALKEMKRDGVKVTALAFPQVAMTNKKGGKITRAYKTGFDMNIFLPNSNLSKFWGDVDVVFPDPTHPDAPLWMRKLLEDVTTRSKIDFDGYIMHWNTPLDLRNFTAHPCLPNSVPPVLSKLENIFKSTLCPEVKYHNRQTHKQFNNKYGHAHTVVVAKALESEKPKRSFLLNLASYTGTGHWAGIWGGMYSSTWESLQESLEYVQEATIYGIPLSGTPICGHLGATETELCARWFQAGLFYPLAMSFYDADEGERGPLNFNIAFTRFVSQSLQLRYSLLPYLYSLFYNAHKHGSPVLRPLFFEFPQFQQARSQKNVFLWGEGLLFLPCMEEKKESIVVWLPNVDWFEFYSGNVIETPSDNKTGHWLTLPAPMYYVNVFIRGGHVIFTQTPHTSIADTRKTPYTVYVALDRASGQSNGYLVVDDGESIGGLELHVTVKVANNLMSLKVKGDEGVSDHLERTGIATRIENIKIYGIDGPDETDIQVKVDGKKLDKFKQSLFFAGVLEIHHELKLDVGHEIEWTVLA